MERKTYWACVIYENIKRLDENKKKKGKNWNLFHNWVGWMCVFSPHKKK